eukprot:s126_g18.t1
MNILNLDFGLDIQTISHVTCLNHCKLVTSAMSLTPIAITALRHSAFYSPLLYTIRSGLLEAEGLKPSYAPQTPQSRTAVEQVTSGEAHVSQLAVAASFAELEKTKGRPTDLVHFAQINERDGFFLVGRQGNFQWQHLEKKKVLVDHLFQPLALMKYACHLQNVDYSSIEVVDAGGPDAMEQAFRDGQGDFVHLQGPTAQQLEHEGKGVVVASMGDVIGPVAFSSLFAKRDWLRTDMAKAFMKAYGKGRRATAELSAKEVAQVVQPFFEEINPSTPLCRRRPTRSCWMPSSTVV